MNPGKFRALTFSFLTLFITGPAVAGLPDFCLQTASDLQCSPKANPARDVCELELKTAGCEDYVKLHPELKSSGKLKSCSELTVCEESPQSTSFIQNCAKPFGSAVVDGFVGIYKILAGEVGIPSEQDLAKLEYFKDCNTPEKKRAMLGSFANYFKKEEIEGHPQRPDINPDDVANHNYLHGYSCPVLYRKLLQKLKKDFQTRGMNEKFIEPWSEKEARLPLSLNELIDSVLTKAGINNTACFKPEVVWEMRCYALGTLVDPTLVAGAGFKLAKMAGLAGKEALLVEKAATAVSVVDEVPSRQATTFSKERQIYIWEQRERGNAELSRTLETDVAREYKAAPIKNSTPIPFMDGVTGGSYVELVDGTKGVWKPDKLDGSQAAAEVAAYEIDRHLGLNSVPITVIKEVKGQKGSFQLWVNKTAESTVNDPGHFVFYDYLIGNSDRHAGNYLISEGRPIAIDNGNAFRPQSGVEDFPGHVDEIIKSQKIKEKAVLEERAKVDRARRAGVNPSSLRKMESELEKVEKKFQLEKKQAAQDIADLGLTQEAAAKLRTTSNKEWNKMMDGLPQEERAGFFFRKTLAEDAIKKAEDYFGTDIYRDPKKPVEFKKPQKRPEKNPYLQDMVGSGL